MTTTGLARHYGALTAGERLSLLLAAAERGDWVEHGRLLAAAPRVTLRIPHTVGRAAGLHAVLAHHRAEHLTVVAAFFQARHLSDGPAAGGEPAGGWPGAVRLAAYLVVALADGWRAFAAAEGLPTVGIEGLVPGADAVAAAVGECEPMAFTAAEALDYGRQLTGSSEVALRTAAVVAANLRAAYAGQVARWGG